MTAQYHFLISHQWWHTILGMWLPQTIFSLHIQWRFWLSLPWESSDHLVQNPSSWRSLHDDFFCHYNRFSVMASNCLKLVEVIDGCSRTFETFSYRFQNSVLVPFNNTFYSQRHCSVAKGYLATTFSHGESVFVVSKREGSCILIKCENNPFSCCGNVAYILPFIDLIITGASCTRLP